MSIKPSLDTSGSGFFDHWKTQRRDKKGLANAQLLRGIIDLIVATLEASNLPDQITLAPTDTVKNPFE